MIRVFEAFAGYGSQAIALKRLAEQREELTFEFVGISEIDKKAERAYRALHGDVTNYGDIAAIEWGSVPDFDLFTYSFPCQDISIAGLRKGLGEGSGTRSSLIWECKRAIEAKRPKYLLMENVKALTGKRNMPHFAKWLRYLRESGYRNHWQVMNAKCYGVPQNRERVFLVSVLDEDAYDYFQFPKPFVLTRRLQDVLEQEVGERYYLAPEKTAALMEQFAQSLGEITSEPTDRIIRLFNMYERVKGKDKTQGRVYSPKGISPTLNALSGGGLEPKILIPIGTDKSGCSTTIPAHYYKAGWTDYRPIAAGNKTPHVGVMEFGERFAIRKLTPRETGRLMGLSEKNIDAMIQAGLSHCDLYKLHGNSIVVDVLYYLFDALFR